MLFLHGAGGVPAWLPFFDAIAQGRQLLVPDHPGFGASEDTDDIREVPDLAMFYLDLMDQLQLEHVHLVGHSLGAWVAAEIAVRNASRLKSLTLISAAGIRLKGSPMGDMFIWSPEEAVRNLYHDQCFADRQLAEPPTSEQLDVLIRNRYTFAKLAWEPRGFNPALEKWLHRIKLPTRILWGAQDKVIPSNYSQLWKQHLPQATVHLIDECGHLPLVEKHEATARLVNDYLNEVTP
ncbi:MAG TPA: alpha/beta fold hydrolase [Steroidobacteraceae bacterium]